MILPAAMRYQTELATNAASLKALDYAIDMSSLDEVCEGIAALRAGIVSLRAELAAVPHELQAEAEHAGTHLLPAMTATRAAADSLEALVADDLWPMATYQEMLFIL